MRNYREHLIAFGSSVKQALAKLNELSQDAILFVVDEQDKLLGSLTDGDIRRGLLNAYSVDSKVDEIIQRQPRHIQKGNYSLEKIIEYREQGYRIIPVVDKNNVVIDVINFKYLKSYLPLDAIIMAGGEGQRLKPLTLKTPKPLLSVGSKPIIEHNIDRLVLFGINNFWISVKYLGEQIKNYFGNGEFKSINIEYVWEDNPLGTIGAVSKIENLRHNNILITNSDLLTNIDYEQFYLDFINQDADFAILTIPYSVSIPYAVLETDINVVKALKEKPTYEYFSNGGVYLVKKEMLAYLPKNSFYNATDLIEELIRKGKKVISFPFKGYWLDIGRHEDYKKAQEDISHTNLL
jgi:dTDP-glucose pyrophosphorylase